MKTLRKNILASVIGASLAIGIGAQAAARDAPQQQREDARHGQGHDKAKPQPAHAAPQKGGSAARGYAAPAPSYRAEPRTDPSRKTSPPSQFRWMSGARSPEPQAANLAAPSRPSSQATQSTQFSATGPETSASKTSTNKRCAPRWTQSPSARQHSTCRRTHGWAHFDVWF